MPHKRELLDLDVEMPEDDDSQPNIVRVDPGEPDPKIIGSQHTPDEIRSALEGLVGDQGEVVDDKGDKREE